MSMKIKLEDIIDFIFIAFFSLYCLLPSFQNDMDFIMIVLAVVAYTAFVALTDKPETFEKIMIFALLIVFVSLCYYFLTETATINSNVDNYNLKRFLSKFNQLSMSFLPLLFLYRANKIFSQKTKKIFVVLCLAIFTYVIINSYMEYQVNERAARAWAEFEEQAENNVATYGYIYAVSAFIPMVFAFAYNVHNKLFKFTGAIAVICLFGFLLSAQYTLALLIPALCCVIYVFQTSKSSAGKVVTVLLLPVILLVVPYVFEYLSTIVESADIKMRFKEIAMFFRGKGADTYDLNDRLERYKICLQYFASSPIVGKEPPVDGHSTLFSFLCDVGLLGSIPFYYMYFLAKKLAYKAIGCEKNKKIYFSTFLALVILGFLNPILSTYTLSYVVWFLTPMCIILLKENRVKGFESLLEEERKNEKLGI
ncbi:MAG: hypothetical protein IJD97_08895 [Clostridia bacterium]|nr:hypothetical protein [Clostridia bacterium]